MLSSAGDWMRRWLCGLGLQHYVPVFAEHRVREDIVHLLTREDLREMGVTRVGDLRRLVLAIEELRQQKPTTVRKDTQRPGLSPRRSRSRQGQHMRLESSRPILRAPRTSSPIRVPDFSPTCRGSAKDWNSLANDWMRGWLCIC